jgi:hypothetical protein
MECSATGKDNCRCTYRSCSRRGNCCQCVAYHRSKGEFTACFFSPEAERSYDRSFKRLLADRGR